MSSRRCANGRMNQHGTLVSNGTSAFHRAKCEAKIALFCDKNNDGELSIYHVGVAHLAERTLSSRTNLSLVTSVTSLWKRVGNLTYRSKERCGEKDRVNFFIQALDTALKRRRQTNKQLGWTWYVEGPEQASALRYPCIHSSLKPTHTPKYEEPFTFDNCMLLHNNLHFRKEAI